MARLPRLDLVDVPQHVVQRGNNRLPVFLDDGDRRRYLHCLGEALPRFGCELHAYVLMDNHVHLLVTPRATGAVSRLMHTFSRNYVGLFNARHGRTGTLWEGRYKACLVDTDAYLLACSRYIELNPVRAGMVDDPARHPWSSYGAHALERPDPLWTPHAVYLGLARSAAARAEAYRALVVEALTPELIDQVRLCLRQQRVFGSSRFQRQVEAKLQRFAGTRPAHRPRREPAA